ncbi:MAG: hypothetical protein ACE5JD_13610 [Candidatus Methylomirabilia bacterium]
MEIVTLIIAVVALVIAVLAFVRSGGAQDVRTRVDVLSSKTETARDRTANALDRLERLIRGREKPESEKEEESGGSSTPQDPQ